MDLTMRSKQNGALDLPILSRGYGTLVDQVTPLDQAFLQSRETKSAKKLPRLHPPTRTTIPMIPSHPNVKYSS